MNTSKELKLKLGKAVIEERNIKFKLLNNSLSDLEKKELIQKRKSLILGITAIYQLLNQKGI